MLFTPIAAYDAIPSPSPYVTEDVAFADLSRMARDLTDVDVVITPLIGTNFDAFELIEKLGASKFRGRLQVISRNVGVRHMVLAELRAHAEPFGIVVDLRH